MELAAEENPSGPDIYYNLGLAYSQTNQLSLAATAFERALELRPASAETAYRLGLILMTLNEPQKALAAFHAALSVRPARADDHLMSGGVYRWLGRVDAANLYFWMGTAYNSEGDHSLAADLYRKSINLEPDRSLTHYKLTLSYILMREIEAARQQLRSLATLDPDLAERAAGLLSH